MLLYKKDISGSEVAISLSSMNYIYVTITLIIFAGVAFFVADSKSSKREADMEASTTEQSSVDNTRSVPIDSDGDVGESKEEKVSSDSVDEPISVADEASTIKTFEISGKNYAFDQTEIIVKEGDTVTINFTSTGGFHDWVVDEFNAATDRIRPGASTSITFVASKKGTFEYYCSVGSHRAQGMVGTLIVE